MRNLTIPLNLFYIYLLPWFENRLMVVVMEILLFPVFILPAHLGVYCGCGETHFC